MIIKYSNKIMERFGNEIFNYMQTLSVDKFVTYMIDWRYRKAVHLKSWIKNQVDNPTEKVLEAVGQISKKDNYDKQMIEILKWVKINHVYKGDIDVWNIGEKWQTVDETLSLGTGDCEDISILIYVLGRLFKVPANRLMLICGYVKTNTGKGGHCYLGYRPKNYPMNWAFLDWCYDSKVSQIGVRPLFTIIEKNIQEYRPLYWNERDSKYLDIWFAFNEEKSFTKFRDKVNKNGK